MNRKSVFPEMDIKIRDCKVNRFILFLLFLSCFNFIFVIVYLSINTNSIIKCGSVKLNIKHPIVYHIGKEYDNKIRKEYNLEGGIDITPIIISYKPDDSKDSLNELISRFSKNADEVMIDSKSDSDVCLMIKRSFKYKPNDRFGYYTVSFTRIIKTEGYIIKIIAGESGVVVLGKSYKPAFLFEKPNFDKEIKIIRNIKIIDKAGNDIWNRK